MAIKTYISPKLLTTAQIEENKQRIARITLDLLVERLQQVRHEREVLAYTEARIQQLIDELRRNRFPEGDTNITQQLRQHQNKETNNDRHRQ